MAARLLSAVVTGTQKALKGESTRAEGGQGVGADGAQGELVDLTGSTLHLQPWGVHSQAGYGLQKLEKVNYSSKAMVCDFKSSGRSCF